MTDMPKTLAEALNSIGYALGLEVEENLAGKKSGYDEQLVFEIARVCKDWEQRRASRVKRWSIFFFDGDLKKWDTIKNNLKQEEAYRVWYDKTNGGKDSCNSGFKSFFYLGRDGDESWLADRDSMASCEEEDDFSYQYLLNKSFGE